MTIAVIGPVGDAANAAQAAKLLASGATVVVWDEDAVLLGAAVESLPREAPGRLSTWAGRGDDEALRAFIEEVLDPPVK